MKLMIGDNIRKYRKALGLTQEQLAEAVGVTVGAVSKWESKMTNPDISIIIELADLFGLSTDVLLDYQQHNSGLKTTVETLKRLCNDKKYDEGIKEAEKALKKFPNNFDIVYHSASLYSLKCFEQKDKASAQRALELFNRSLELINQNTNERINEHSVQNRITEVYIELGDDSQALERLKRYNAEGANCGMIGMLLALRLKQYDEALPYLYESLLSGLSNVLRASIGFANFYSNKGKHYTALDILKWAQNTFNWLKPEGTASYLDKIEVILLTGCALLYADMNQYDLAETYLRKAYETAQIFDAAPDFTFSDIRFYSSGQNHFAGDNFGETAMKGIMDQLSEDKNSDMLLQILERIQHENE